MKQALYRSLVVLGLPRLLAWLHRHRAVILIYHGLTDRRHEGVENQDGLHLDVEMFGRHLAYLRRHFHPISLHRLLDHIEAGTPLPERSVVLTFDDGFESNYALAYPLLREFDVPATIFLTTGFVDEGRHQWTDRVEFAVGHADEAALRAQVDGQLASRGATLSALKQRLKRMRQEQRDAEVERLETALGVSLASATEIPAIYRPLDWDQIREMRDGGLISFGNHTVHHYILANCDDDTIRHDIGEAKRIIEDRLGEPCPLFCYPNGGAGDFDERCERIARELGHRCALLTVPGHNDLHSDPFALRRVGVMQGHSFEDFVMAVAEISTWSMRAGELLRGRR